MTRDDNLKILEDIAKDAEQMAKDRIKAVEVLNQMLGYNVFKPRQQKVVVEVVNPNKAIENPEDKPAIEGDVVDVS